MIEKSQNKSMQNEAKETKAQPEAGLKEFHFPGGGEFIPQTILAKTREEAEAEYIRSRKPVRKVEEVTNEQQ